MFKIICRKCNSVTILPPYFFAEKRKLFRKYKTCVRELTECKEDETRFVKNLIYNSDNYAY